MTTPPEPRKPLIYIEYSGDRMLTNLVGSLGEQTMDYDDADIIMFTGGSDISPSLYGEAELEKTSTNPERDGHEVSMYNRLLANATKRGRPIAFVGICRGGQLLNVMNGGKLWQDVEKHRTHHSVIDNVSGRVIRVSSAHHQMMRNPKAHQNIPYQLLAVACDFDGKPYTNTTKFSPKSGGDLLHDSMDIEAIWYPTTRSLCFQPHPEYIGFVECTKLFKEYIATFVIPSLNLSKESK